ncbi:Cell division protein FtsL [Candidatus Burkholderia humilis]|nr:Cell division protein FtsL [Candidatus Burkholderia humilis]
MPLIHLPTLRLSEALPSGSFGRYAGFALSVAIAALSPLGAFAQSPNPIDSTTSVAAKPLDTTTASQDTDAALRADFERRQKALDKRTQQNDYAYGVKHDCYSKFFVNHCLDGARNEMREKRQQIRQEQLALDDEQRAERAKERDQQTAIKQAQYEADALNRAAAEKSNQQAFEDKQRQNALAAAQRNAEAPQRAANQAAYDRKQADFQKKLDEARARGGVQDAQEREQKTQRYEQKQHAATHRAEVEARQKEAARKQ